MSKFTHHIFVCCNQRPDGHPRGCCDDGSSSLKDAFKDEVKQRKLTPEVRANTAGCLDQCEYGPVVVIYPQEIWYGGVKHEDVPRIIEETIVQGRIIPELVIPDHLLNTKGGRQVLGEASRESSGDEPK